MLEMLNKEITRTVTENGGAAYTTTEDACLDLFAGIGALRHQDEHDIITRFIRACTENKDDAMKLLFYARDVREGLGERRVFRIILKWLAMNETDTVIKNLSFIDEYGRYDDYLCLLDTPCEDAMLQHLHTQFEKDCENLKNGKPVSLLGKWLPSINATDSKTINSAKKVSKAFGMDYASYRKALTALRQEIRIIENNLRTKDYSFAYENQPSRALFKYRQAFRRNDAERYAAFLNRVRKGEVKMNTSNITPYELVDPYLDRDFLFLGTDPVTISKEEAETLNTTWNALEDYGNDENILVVADNSGSMYINENPKPASVALSLAIYFAERNTGTFQNHFILFSDQSQLIEIKGDTFVEKLRYVSTFSDINNTDLEAVFNVILKTAVKNNVPQEDLPKKVVIISDMEFDQCTDRRDLTVFENAKENFAQCGYTLPEVIFWNVDCRNSHQPVKKNDEGVVLVSGATPKIFSMLTSGTLTPLVFMQEILHSKRYAVISA